MKRTVAVALAIVMTSTSFSAAQTPPIVQPNVVEDPGKITPLKKGQPAPYPGVLFSPKAAAVVATELGTAKEKIKIEVAAAVGSSEAKKDFKIAEINAACKTDKETLTAQLDNKSKQIDALSALLRVKEKETPNRTVWASLGFVAGITVSLLGVFIVGGIGSSAK